MNYVTALITTAATAALLTGCTAAPPEPPIVPAATAVPAGVPFLDGYPANLIGPAAQSPAPQTWQDLLVPPALIGPGAQQPHSAAEASGQVSAPNGVNHG